MTRQSFLGDETWDDERPDRGIRTRVFRRDPGQRLTASVQELAPGSPGHQLHMHYGDEEMFFVVEGHPVLRTGDGEERLSPGDVVHCPSGRAGLHTFGNPTDERVRIIGVSSNAYPNVLVYPEEGVAWVATRDPDFPAPPGADPGVVARFAVPLPVPVSTSDAAE